MRTAKPSVKAVFKREDSDRYFMYIVDPITGKRTRRTTGKTTYEEAMKVYEDTMAALGMGYGAASVEALLAMYSDPATNPRYQIALKEGTNYGEGHAASVAGLAKQISRMLKDKAPRIYSMPICELTKMEVNAVRDIIMKTKGQTRGAQEMFSAFKVMLTQAEQDGSINTSPGKGVRDIPYVSKQRPSFPPEYIKRVVEAKDHFRSVDEWAFIAIMATTGMRMSEALAIAESDIYEGTLTIQHALKTNSRDSLGAPKWNFVRVIPLSQTTLYALSCVTPDEATGRYFYHNRSWGVVAAMKMMSLMCGLYPEDSELYSTMTSHTLRHSLNTNLLVAGHAPLLVAEYMSWNHQVIMDMQKRYTHVYAEAMRPLADRIDEMYMPDWLRADMQGRKALTLGS